MDIVQRRTRLIEWLEVIRSDVQELILDQHLFWEVQAIIAANARFARKSGLLNQWMASCFVQAAAVGIRRHAKFRDDSISLRRFLEEIRKYPSLVSREFYSNLAADAPKWLKDAGEEEFDSIAGQGAGELPTALLGEQIGRLHAVVGTIEHYVDQRIAHNDSQALAKPDPTFKDLEDALKVLEGLVVFYWKLLKGNSSGDLLGMVPPDWKGVFTFPWIEQHEMASRCNEIGGAIGRPPYPEEC